MRDEEVRAQYMCELHCHMPAFQSVLVDARQAHADDPPLVSRLVVAEFGRVLSQSVDSVLGRRTAGRKPAVPWWSRELRTLIDARRAAYTAARTARWPAFRFCFVVWLV